MSKTWWIVARVVTALMLLGLVIGGGFAVYRLGWAQGYEAGGSGEEVTETAPWMPYGIRPVRPLLAFGLILLGLVVAGKLLRLIFWGSMARRWAMAGGPWMRSLRGAHWHHYHGPASPWCWGPPPERPSDEPTAGPETGAAG